MDALDKIKIEPYILNPEFIASTYVYVEMVNGSRSNSVIGHSVISLFNVFPSSLVDRDKLETKYNPKSGQMNMKLIWMVHKMIKMITIARRGGKNEW